MSWATAAMLSARFATVTPAGRVPATERRYPGGRLQQCEDEADLQLIDGGYAEPSGVGTLAEIAPLVMREVVAFNARRGDAAPVVPIVLYLEDEPRTELPKDPDDLTAELAVPVIGTQNASALQTATTTWLQRVGAAYSSPCVDPAAPDPGAPPPDTGCGFAATAVHDALTGGVVVAAPLTRPGVDAPLGWSLSPDSRARLDDALKRQGDGCSDDVRPGGYECLERLLDVLARGR